MIKCLKQTQNKRQKESKMSTSLFEIKPQVDDTSEPLVFPDAHCPDSGFDLHLPRGDEDRITGCKPGQGQHCTVHS